MRGRRGKERSRDQGSDQETEGTRGTRRRGAGLMLGASLFGGRRRSALRARERGLFTSCDLCHWEFGARLLASELQRKNRWLPRLQFRLKWQCLVSRERRR